jgi:glycosyltransferase involved in cell wall biosynthesis
MKVGILIVSKDRPEYFKRCLDSFRQAEYPRSCTIMLIDDGSRDTETIRLFNEFNIPGIPIIKLIREKSVGIAANIKEGYETLFNQDSDLVMNFDGDAVIKSCAIISLLELYREHPASILTGFNSTTKNKDGSERHEIIRTEEKVHLKKSVGGLNMAAGINTYEKFMLPALTGTGNWDHKTCINSMFHDIPIVCLYPSVVQHIGLISSMGHSADIPDVADDFYNLQLPDITLIGADTNHYPELEKAAKISCSDIQFGAVKMLAPAEVKSAKDYNLFCMKRFNEYVDTKFALIIQWDGYVLNYKGWNNDFFNYDYIGATWCYKDNLNVGNGGFSLRSKKLLQILATDETLTEYFPEDHHICRTYRTYLENQYGIRFAPEETANKFSIEAYGSNVLPGGNKYSGQFGFHGFNVDYTGSGLPHIPPKPISKIQTRPPMRGFAVK